MQDIKRRIRSVDSTKQITKAMELVSTAKLRKARQRVEENRPYFQKIEEIIRGIIPHTKELHSPFIEGREIKKGGLYRHHRRPGSLRRIQYQCH